MIGAIDIGGTKIEARVFDAAARSIQSRRLPTPRDGFDSFIDALSDQIGWIEAQVANGPETGAKTDVPIGLSLAGYVDPDTGRAIAANLPIGGRDVGAALAARHGRAFPIVNDCMAFAYSEANGGAGAQARSVVGLILGTGVAAGVCYDGAFVPRHGGLAVEVGHLPVPVTTAARLGLDPLECGCGAVGCLETYASGPGLARLAKRRLGHEVSGPELSAALDSGAAWAEGLRADWADVAADVLSILRLTLAPEVIVLGGGLSLMPGVTTALSRALLTKPLGGALQPAITLAQHGDSSGARGAALIARDMAQHQKGRGEE